VDKDEMTRHHLSLRMEHSSLVLKRVAEPLAGVTFDAETNTFKMHKYSVRQGESESDEARTIEECAMKLGAYAYSLRGSTA
jgi:homospermidine synthase